MPPLGSDEVLDPFAGLRSPSREEEGKRRRVMPKIDAERCAVFLLLPVVSARMLEGLGEWSGGSSDHLLLNCSSSESTGTRMKRRGLPGMERADAA
jgi:hypothetical protein